MRCEMWDGRLEKGSVFSWVKKIGTQKFFSSFDNNLNKAAYKEEFRIHPSQ